MNYLKLVNIPVRGLFPTVNGKEGGKIDWITAGFNVDDIRRFQAFGFNVFNKGDAISVYPIFDQAKLDASGIVDSVNKNSNPDDSASILTEAEAETLKAIVEGKQSGKKIELESIKLDFLSSAFAYATKDDIIEIVNTRIDTVANPEFAGINWICRKLGLNLYHHNTMKRLELEEHKNILDAVLPPTVQDDITKGFTIGSLVRVVGDPDVDYVCRDSKEDAAVWEVI